jgi:hypothetical protein
MHTHECFKIQNSYKFQASMTHQGMQWYNTISRPCCHLQYTELWSDQCMIYRGEYIHNNWAAYRLECVHNYIWFTEANVYTTTGAGNIVHCGHAPTYRLSNYCVHIRLCKLYTYDLTTVPYIGDDSVALRLFCTTAHPDDGPVMPKTSGSFVN